jgi:hypothetical protein
MGGAGAAPLRPADEGPRWCFCCEGVISPAVYSKLVLQGILYTFHRAPASQHTHTPTHTHEPTSMFHTGYTSRLQFFRKPPMRQHVRICPEHVIRSVRVCAPSNTGPEHLTVLPADTDGPPKKLLATTCFTSGFRSSRVCPRVGALRVLTRVPLSATPPAPSVIADQTPDAAVIA